MHLNWNVILSIRLTTEKCTPNATNKSENTQMLESSKHDYEQHHLKLIFEQIHNQPVFKTITLL